MLQRHYSLTVQPIIARFVTIVTTVSHWLAALFHKNIIVTLPVLVLAFKFAVRWITREPLKGSFKSLLTFPLDLVFIAAGLLFAGLARRLPQFTAKYPSDREADFYGAIFFILRLLVAALVTVLDRGIRMFWQKAFASIVIIKDFPQLHLPKEDDQSIVFNDEYSRTWFWLLCYWLLMIIMLGLG